MGRIRLEYQVAFLDRASCAAPADSMVKNRCGLSVFTSILKEKTLAVPGFVHRGFIPKCCNWKSEGKAKWNWWYPIDPATRYPP